MGAQDRFPRAVCARRSTTARTALRTLLTGRRHSNSLPGESDSNQREPPRLTTLPNPGIQARPSIRPASPLLRSSLYRLLPLVFLIGAFSASQALDPTRQIDQYGHDVWTAQHGLPGEAVYQILQTPDGYLWLRTSSGLVRFDGVRFVSMDSAFGAEPVKAITKSADGDLLIRTTSHTVIYKSGKFADYRPPAPLPDGEVEAIFETRQNEVMIGADDFVYRQPAAGLSLVRKGTATIKAFLQDESGKIWVGGADELFSYRAGVLVHELSLKLDVPPIAVMMEDREHRIWVGTTRGLFLMDRSDPAHVRMTQVAAKVVRSLVTSVVEDRAGNIWAGTSEAGLVRLQGKDVTSFGAIHSLTDNRVLSIFEDREGSLWVGTGSGLDRFRDTKATSYGVMEGLPGDKIESAVVGKDGSIYVFCDAAGMARIKDRVVTSKKHIPGLSVFYGSSLAADRAGNIWFGTIGGLTRLKDDKFTVYNQDVRLSKSFISAIGEDNESLIVTTSGTLAYRFKNGKVEPFTFEGKTTPLSTPGNYAFTIYYDPHGTLWFGTVKGLFRFVPGQPPAKAQVPQIDFAVTSISDDGRGSLWLGGRTPGLIRYRTSDGRVTHYKKRDGLFDGYPSRVLYDDQGNLWISTSNGIFNANRQDLDDFADGRIATVRTTVYGIADGMKTSEASISSSQPGGARGPDGKLWFTTVKGIVMIDPRHMMHNDLVPPVVIESVVVDDVTMPLNEDFEVPPGKDKMEFHYTALSLLIPERVRFKYQLVGYDHQWVDADTRRVAYYNNLAPGHYRFQVIAANDDGVWNNTGASIGFLWKPHFYQTDWFRFLCVLALVLGSLTGHRISTRLFRRRAAELGRLVDERTAELRETQHHLEQVAFFDSLTSLPNRRMFGQEFRKLLALTRRSEGRFSLLMIDLDKFKFTNDTMGHDAGDALLVSAAARLKAAVRETDCVARLGGDEFVILLAEDQDKSSVDLICERIRHNFADAAIYNGEEMKTTPSIGIAVFPHHGETQEALFKSADMALYRAKRAGGNGWEWCQSERKLEETTLIK